MKNSTKSLFLSLLLHLLVIFCIYSVYLLSIPKTDKRIINENKIFIELKNINSEQKENKNVVKKVKQIHQIKKVNSVKKFKKIKKKLLHRKIEKNPKIRKKNTIKQNNKKQVRRTILKKKRVDLSKVVKNSIDKHVVKIKQKKKNLNKSYNKEIVGEIVRLIKDNLYYPRRARKKGIEGKVVVSFVIDKNGIVQNKKIISSNKPILSRAALKTIDNLSGKFPKPLEKMTINVPFKYNLID